MGRAITNAFGKLNMLRDSLHPRSPFSASPRMLLGRNLNEHEVLDALGRNANLAGSSLRLPIIRSPLSHSSSRPASLPSPEVSPRHSLMSLGRSARSRASAVFESKSLAPDVASETLSSPGISEEAVSDAQVVRPVKNEEPTSHREQQELVDDGGQLESSPDAASETQKPLPQPHSTESDIDDLSTANSRAGPEGPSPSVDKELPPPPSEDFQTTADHAGDHGPADGNESEEDYGSNPARPPGLLRKPFGSHLQQSTTRHSWSSVSSYGDVLPQSGMTRAFRDSDVSAFQFASGAAGPMYMQQWIGGEYDSEEEEDDPRDVSHIPLRERFKLEDGLGPAGLAGRKAPNRLKRSGFAEFEGARLMHSIHGNKIPAWYMIPLLDYDDGNPGGPEDAMRALNQELDPDVARRREEQRIEWERRAEDRYRKEEAGEDFANLDEEARLRLEDRLRQVDENDTVENESFIEPVNPLIRPSVDESVPVTEQLTVETEHSDSNLSASSPERSPMDEKTYTDASSENLASTARYPGPTAENDWFMPCVAPPLNAAPLLGPKRSWILDFKSVALAYNLTIIDRDMFMKLRSQDLLSLEWARSVSEITVYSWEWFIKVDTERKVAIRNAPYRNLPPISPVTSIRARFNLMTLFTATEILLSPPSERPLVVDKFIRICWRLYQFHNFSSLVAILTGLHSEPVAKVMRKHWHKLGAFEILLLKDLISFTSPKGDYARIQQFTRSLIDGKRPSVEPLASIAPENTFAAFTRAEDIPKKKSLEETAIPGQAASHATELSQNETPPPKQQKPYCIPLLHAYLGDLHNYSLLPDFIDPTKPEAPYSRGQGLKHTGIFVPLPHLSPELPLRPLVNVAKQNLICGVVDLVRAAQGLAANYDTEGKIGNEFMAWSRIKALAPEQLDLLAEM